MKEIVRAKGLDELRTGTTHHIAAKPPRKGTTYLDLFALSMERQRLEQELTGIERRRKRIFSRLGDAQGAMDKLVNAVQKEKAVGNSLAESGAAQRVALSEESLGQQWKKMTVSY